MIDRLNDDAWEVRKLIREAEGVADDTMIACARLKQAMITARRNPALGTGVGQTAILRLNRAEQKFAEAVGDLLRVHAELSDVARVTALMDEGIQTEIKGLAETDLPAFSKEAA